LGQAIINQAAEDFQHEEVAGNAEEQLTELKSRAAALGDEVSKLTRRVIYGGGTRSGLSFRTSPPKSDAWKTPSRSWASRMTSWPGLWKIGRLRPRNPLPN
jgi:hypothetical protein